MTTGTDNRPLVNVQHLKMYFPITSGLLLQRQVGVVKAVDDISFGIEQGGTFGLVGESGCGKTTTGRCILRLLRPTSGEIYFEAQELGALDNPSLRSLRKRMQIIFGDYPLTSRTCHAIIGSWKSTRLSNSTPSSPMTTSAWTSSKQPAGPTA